MKQNLACILTMCTLFLFVGSVHSQLVTSEADDGSDGTLRQEILDTPAGGEITFDPAVQEITLTSELIIDKALTITGSDGMEVTIDGNAMSRIFDISVGPVVLNNLNLQNGLADNGGGIRIANAMVTLNNSNIMNCVANGPSGSGGAVLVTTGGSFYANNSNISNNIANRAGGGIEDNSGSDPAIVLNNVVMNANNTGVAPATAAPGNGGAIHITGPGNAEINGGSFANNIAALEGGALWNGSGTMTVDGSTFTENLASGDAADNGGGALFNEGGTLIVMNATITDNVADGTAGSGGGILNNLGTLTVMDTDLDGNTASRAGGAIEDNSAPGGMLTLTNVNMTNNYTGATPGNGGGLHITGPGDSEITGGLVDGNTAAREGGGLWNGSGEMSIIGTTITNNMAIGDMTGGGGVFNNGGTINIDAATTLTGNIATGATPGGRGGAIFNTTDGVLNLANGLAINDNYASRAGGAIEDASNGTLILNGITMTGNSAGVDIGLGNDVVPNPGNGGALHLSGTTNATISGFSTVSNNYAALEGGGLWNNLGTMTVSETFIDGNVASGDGADEGGGGIFNNGGTLVVGNATIISNNVADGSAGSGGGIHSIDGAVTVEDAVIAFNVANRAGGGIELIEGSLEMSGNFNLSDNNTGVAPAVAAPGNGGGLHITGMANATITGGTVSNNLAAREGGGLWNGTGLMIVDGTTLEGNIASGDGADDGGGAIFNNGGTLEVVDALIQNNMADGTAGSGGGIFSISGDVMVTNTLLEGNSANRAGGAVEIVDGDFDFIDSQMIDNDVNGSAGTPAPGNGGGFHVTGMSGTLNFVRSTITGNEAGREGGGLWNQSGSTMNVMNTTLNDNAAFGTTETTGGGALFNNGGVLNVMVSTISGNNSTGAGGGILNGAEGTINIDATTIALNMADLNGGGISGNDITLKNSIVALNMSTDDNDVSGMIASEGFNIVASDEAGALDAMMTDMVGMSPDLGPLADNGGMTMTHALLEGSIGVDAGDPADMFNDQRDFEIVGIRDIGAFEFGTLDMGMEACYGDSILEYVQGTKLNGSPLDADRTDPSVALGEPDRMNEEGGFVSLGYGGFVSIMFEGAVYDQEGDDILVWETSFNSDDCESDGIERAQIELSMDGVNWMPAGPLCRDGGVDIANAGLEFAIAIKIINDSTSTTFDGYDVDGVEAINGCEEVPEFLEDCFGSEVLAYNPGPMSNGQPITDPERNDPGKALGAPQLDDTFNFVSLGYGGELIVGFPGEVFNGPGDDILVAETTFGNKNFENYPESADVFVSQNGVDFFQVGSMTTKQLALFDIDDAGQGFEFITAVKVVDTTPEGSVSDDGFDVDAVQALNGCDSFFDEIGGECEAAEVVEYVEGAKSNGSALTASRTNPDMALGEPEGTDAMVFVTLGYGGSITLAFNGSIPNEDGADIEVVETSFGNMGCEAYREYADVYVSQNGVNFFFAKTVCKSDNLVDIDDANQGFAFVNYVKIVNNDELTTTPDGFDLDGVLAIHNCSETVIDELDGPGEMASISNSTLTSMPNPTEGNADVVFTVGNTSRTTLEVFDMNGRNVATLFNQDAQQDEEYRVNFEGTFLPNGVYLYRLTTGNEVIVEKFMIAK